MTDRRDCPHPATFWPFLARYPRVEIKPMRNETFGWRWGRGYRLNSSVYHLARKRAGLPMSADDRWDALRAEIDEMFSALRVRLGVSLA